MSRIWRLGFRGVISLRATAASHARHSLAPADCFPATGAARKATARPELVDDSQWFAPVIAAAAAAGAFGYGYSSPAVLCMNNVNGVPAGQVSARELPDIRGQQPDPLPPGQVGGHQVQAEDVGAVHHRRSRAPQSAGHQSAVTDDQQPGGFTWPHLGKPESQAIRDVYDLVGSPQNHFESPETGYPYVRWVRAAA